MKRPAVRIRRFHLIFIGALGAQYFITLWWETPPVRPSTPLTGKHDSVHYVARLPPDSLAAFADPSALFGGSGNGFTENTWDRPEQWPPLGGSPPTTDSRLTPPQLPPGWLFAHPPTEANPLDAPQRPPTLPPDLPPVASPRFPQSVHVERHGALAERAFLSPPALRGSSNATNPTVLLLTVNARGAVVAATMTQSCGDAQLDAHATEALRKARFEPVTNPQLTIGQLTLYWESVGTPP